MEVTLSKSIKAHGKEESVLKFRSPNAGDLRGIRLSLGEGGLSFETDAILDLAAKLADVPPSSLDGLPFIDLIAIGAKIGPFLDGLEKILKPQSATSSSEEDSAQQKSTN